MANACRVHLHTGYTPIDEHHIWPKGLGGPDTDANLITICPNGHRAVHEYLRLLQKGGGKVPWLERRKFGRKVRRLAERGYAQLPAGEKVPAHDAT